MQLNRKKVIIILSGVVLLAVIGILVTVWISNSNPQYTLSGTIEATEIRLSTRNGGVVKQVVAGEGDPVKQGEYLAQIVSGGTNFGERITSPINGVLLERLFEPGELASPGNVVMVVADLNQLELKVYAPEDRYGQYSLGDVYPVTVDSFPGTNFNGKISHIAGQAEFTPRNVTTAEGRKSTVFAITLDIINNASFDILIPGMPADVHFTAR